MEKIITGRHMDIDPPVKEAILDRLAAFEERYRKLTKAEVVVEMQRSSFATEVILHGKRLEIEADAKEHDLWLSVDLALEKAERQLEKRRQRRQEFPHVPLGELEAEIAEQELGEVEELSEAS